MHFFKRSLDLAQVPLELLEQELRRRGLVTVSVKHEEMAGDLVSGKLSSVDTSWILEIVRSWQSVAREAFVQTRELAAECGQLRAENVRVEREAHVLSRALMGDDIDNDNGAVD
jgi:hypothetical protein